MKLPGGVPEPGLLLELLELLELDELEELEELDELDEPPESGPMKRHSVVVVGFQPVPVKSV
jgi:hypothetical protein